jgi:hypothetical protein
VLPIENTEFGGAEGEMLSLGCGETEPPCREGPQDVAVGEQE